MSVWRLYFNLSSSDITWNWLPIIPSILLVSDDSEEGDGDDEEDKEDEHLRCLHFFLQDLCLLGEGEDFYVDEDEEVLSYAYSLSACFCINFLLFLCLVALLPLFRF